jgi:disulfide bond formation protein DsbB
MAAMNVVRFILRWWGAFGLIAALSLLGIAYFIFERWLGYAPCHLCIGQRWLYAWAAVFGVLGVIWAVVSRSPGTARLCAYLMFALFLGETILATFHAGVELKWWKGPSSCTGSAGPIDMSQIRDLLNGAVSHTPMCDVAFWSFAGVSMAGWNAIAAAVLAVISLAAAARKPEPLHGR